MCERQFFLCLFLFEGLRELDLLNLLVLKLLGQRVEAIIVEKQVVEVLRLLNW